MTADEGFTVIERIDLGSATDAEVYQRLLALERKHGCTYAAFVARGDFDHRPGEEWLDESLWRLLEEELAERVAARFPAVTIPIDFPSEA